jgi:GT2 family glycosyltransferase
VRVERSHLVPPAGRRAAAFAPDISVVIASWNARAHLLNCLRSFEKAGHVAAIETIVVDNGSDDGTPAAVRALFPRTTLVCNATNLGFARAVNMGIERASGRYVCLSNSDILLRPGALDELARFLDAHPDAALVGPRVLHADGTLQHSCRKFPGLLTCTSEALALHRLFPRSPRLSGQQMLHWDHASERSVDALSGCFCMARRSALGEIGGLDEDFFMYAEDVDLCMRLRAAGWSVWFCPAAEVIHFSGASSANDPRRFARAMIESSFRLYRKHYRRPVAAYLAALIAVHHALRLVFRLALFAVQPARRASLRPKLDPHATALGWMLLRRGPRAKS